MTSLQMLGLSGFSDSCTGSIFILDMQRAVCIKQARRHKILQSAMRGKRERERWLRNVQLVASMKIAKGCGHQSSHFRHKIAKHTHHTANPHTLSRTCSRTLTLLPQRQADRHSHSKQIRFLHKQIISAGGRQQAAGRHSATHPRAGERVSVSPNA